MQLCDITLEDQQIDLLTKLLRRTIFEEQRNRSRVYKNQEYRGHMVGTQNYDT